MHIGFFSDGYAPQLNGVATSLEMLTNELEARGNTISVFVPKMGNYVDSRPRVYRVPSLQIADDPPTYLASPVLPKVLRREPGLGLDIAHVHSPFLLQSLAYQTARRAHIPLISTYHTLLPMFMETVRAVKGYSISPHIAEVYSAWSSNMCDHIIAPSPKIKVLLEQYGVRRPITVIYNGIVIERFQNRARGFLRTRFGLSEKDKFVVSVGRLTPEKNPLPLVEMMPQVLNLVPDAYLVFVGQGLMHETLRDRARELGVGDRVLFTGPLPNSVMPDIYAGADVYVSASYSEVHSIAALEALAAGLPLVVADDRSFEQIIIDGETGFSVAPAQPEFGARVAQILRQPEMHRHMRARALAHSINFTVQAQADAVIRLYAEVSARKHSEPPRRPRWFWHSHSNSSTGLTFLTRPN